MPFFVIHMIIKIKVKDITISTLSINMLKTLTLNDYIIREDSLIDFVTRNIPWMFGGRGFCPGRFFYIDF